MNNVIKFTVNPFTSLENIMKQVNSVAEGKIIEGIFVKRKSFFKSEVEVLVSSPTIIRQKVFVDKPIEIIKARPSKFKSNATSQFYCVYKKGEKWTYKFVNRKLSKKAFYGLLYDNEYDAAIAYDKHRYSVEGDLAKLNFPEMVASE